MSRSQITTIVDREQKKFFIFFFFRKSGNLYYTKKVSFELFMYLNGK